MKAEITERLVEEHRLILRMLDLVESRSELAAAGKYKDFTFFQNAVDFIRNYADRFHHAKEEDVLFEALVKNGMPRENSPVAAMLLEHEEGRRYVRAMEEATRQALAGECGRHLIIAANASNYVNLLREHIQKEDGILYPLAERLIPEGMRPQIATGYRLAQEKTSPEFDECYRRMVEHYEAERLERAA